jgi:hypothetical protein
VVIAGNIINGAAGGIALGAGSERARLAVVQGNLLRNLRGRGVAPAAAADQAITGNVIEGARSH